MQRISAQKACANALATYVASTFRAQGLSDVVVDPHWPPASKVLPPRAVTVLLAGQAERELTQATVTLKNNITNTTADYQTAAFNVRQPMQIDVWATSDIARDDLIARMDDMLNQGCSKLPGVFNPDPLAEGVTLPLGASIVLGADPITGQSQWNGNAMFWFDSFVESDDPDSTTRNEYRATARGEAQFVYTQDRVVDRMLNPKLKLKVHEIGAVGAAPSTQLYDIYTITSTGKGFIYSTGP